MTSSLIIRSEIDPQVIAAELDADPRLKSLHTKRGYLRDLVDFENWRAGRPLSKLLVESYAAELQQAGKAPRSINRKLAAIRWHARRLADTLADRPVATEGERVMRAELMAQAERIAGAKGVRGEREPAGRHIATSEVKALLLACVTDRSPAGKRDAAIIALAWSAGPRRSEIAGLTLADYVASGPNEGDLRIAHGKGDKSRTVYVFNGAASYLTDWLTLRGDADGPLWYVIGKNGVMDVGHGMSDEALAQMLEKRRLQAGVKKLSWHDFRRTFAGNLLDAGVDLVTVQKLMGHSSSTTTAGYDRRPDETRRKASRLLHVPYISVV